MIAEIRIDISAKAVLDAGAVVSAPSPPPRGKAVVLSLQ